MISLRISLVFLLSILPAFSDAKVGESLEMRVYNPNFQPVPKNQLMALLKKANLEGHGYNKEIIKKLVKELETDENIYEEMHYYYKKVNCSRIRDTVQELQSLMPGSFGVDVISRISKEIKTRKLTNMKQCEVGVEFHLKGGCIVYKSGSARRNKRDKDCTCCKCVTNCIVTKDTGTRL